MPYLRTLLAVIALAGSVDPVTIRVRGGGFEPATVTVTVHMLPHEDNRAVCVALSDPDGEFTHDCRPLLGVRGPATIEMTFKDIWGGGDYEAHAALCRGGWDGDRCAQKWLRATPARFIIVGRFGNKSYKRRRPHA